MRCSNCAGHGIISALPDPNDPKECPECLGTGREHEMFEGKLTMVRNPERNGWWRYHDHYDRNGYCDNPGRGY